MQNRVSIQSLLIASLMVILFSSIQTISFTSAATISQFSDVDLWQAALENPNARQDINFDFLLPITPGLNIGTQLITPQGIIITDQDGIVTDLDSNDMVIILLNSDATIVFPASTGGAGLTDSFKHDKGNGIAATDFDGDTDKARGFKSPGTQNFIGFTSSAGIQELKVGTGGSQQIGIDIIHVELNTPLVANDDSFSAAQGVLHNEIAPGVLDNDTDIDNDPLTAVLDDNVSNGALTLNDDGSSVYTSNSDFVGLDQFTYFANDGFSNSLSPATVTISVYTAEIVNDPITIEDKATIRIEDHGANTDDATIQTVDFILESSVSTGKTFTATESSLIPGIFGAKIPVSEIDDVYNTADALQVELDDNNEDTITLTYLEATDTALVNTGNTGAGLEATSTEPLRWNSDIYELGDSASLTRYLHGTTPDSNGDGIPEGDGVISIDSVWVRTSTDPVGFVIPIDEGTDDGILDSISNIALLHGGPSDPILFELTADEDDIIEATLISSLTGGVYELFRTYDWQIDNDNDGTEDADIPVYGGTGDFPLVGNWDSSVAGESIGIFRSPTGLLVLDDNGNGVYNPETDSVLLGFGTVGTVPAIGDWDGNGEDSVGVYTPSTGVWDIDTDGSGAIDVTSEQFGGFRDFPLVGDWDGDGVDQMGIFRHAGGLFAFDTDSDFLNDVVAGNGQDVFCFGEGGQGDVPVVGDFDTARAGTEVGFYRPSTGEWFIDENVDCITDVIIPPFGGVGDIPLIGDWNGDGQDDIGIYRPATGLWALDSNGNRINEVGGADALFFSGGVGDIPMVGDFDGDGTDGTAILIVEPPTPGALVDISEIVSPETTSLTAGSGFKSYTAATCDDDLDYDGICDEWVITTGADRIEFDIGGTTHEQGCRPLLVDTAGTYSTAAGDTLDASLLDPANNAIPCPANERKQMFYEIDYMTGHKPLQKSIEAVIIAFRDSPVPNDDGSTGIDLFVTVDEDYGTHRILIPFSGDEDNPGYDQFKESFFGTAAERARADSDGFLSGKFQYTRSMAFLHQLSDSPTASGYSEIGGNDAAITMGAFVGSVGNVPLQSGTVLHEVGHNISLDHGGDDNTNCKPNYLSVMNYIFQFEDLVETRPLDFSNDLLADLDENNLNENLGIEISTHNSVTLETLVGGVGEVPILTLTGIAADYNRDGDSTDTGVIENVNYFADITDCNDGTLEVLDGYNDWPNIKLPFRDEASFADGRHTPAVLVNEIDLDKFENLVQNAENAIISELISQLEDLGDPSTTDPIIAKLQNANANIQIGFDFFDEGLIDLYAAEGLIGVAGIVDSEILALINEAILILENATIADEFAIQANLNPSASSQKIIVRDASPFDITLSGADAQGDPLTFNPGAVSPAATYGDLGPLTVNSPDFNTATGTFTPGVDFANQPGETPSASFTFNVVDDPDGNLSNVATVDIFLNPNAPTASSQNHIIAKNEVLDLVLTGADGDGDSLMFIVDAPSAGTLTPPPDPTLLHAAPSAVSTMYTPPVDFVGVVTFTFTTNDGVESSATATVTIVVASQKVEIYVETPPTASTNPGEQSKPVIAFNDNSPVDMIIRGSDTLDASTINPMSVHFGPFGFETTGAPELHTSSISYFTDHVFDQTAPNVSPNTQNNPPDGDGPLAIDGFPDMLVHFSQDDINVDPVNNDAMGEQVVCITGAFLPAGEGIQQFFGCLSLTVGDKEGGGGDPPAPSGLDPLETAEAITMIEDIQSEISSLDRADLSKKNKNQLTRQLDKAIDSLNGGDPGTAIFNLNAFQDQVVALDPADLDPLLATGFSDDTQLVIDFIVLEESD